MKSKQTQIKPIWFWGIFIGALSLPGIILGIYYKSIWFILASLAATAGALVAGAIFLFVFIFLWQKLFAFLWLMFTKFR
jgi:hypothetical protein